MTTKTTMKDTETLTENELFVWILYNTYSQLLILYIIAELGGMMAEKLRLPRLIGMILSGIFADITGLIYINYEAEMVKLVRKSSLVIILMRAGLDLDPKAVQKLFYFIISLGWIPWAFETIIVASLSVYLFEITIYWAIILGAIEAAVSPAVVVPSLISLKSKGYGVAKGIPTLILAVTGIEDAIAVATFGVTTAMMINTKLSTSLIKGPGSVLLGIISGFILGHLCSRVPYYNNLHVGFIRTLLLPLGGLIILLGFSQLGMDGAGPLACIISAYIASKGWTQNGWQVGQNEVCRNLKSIWRHYEPLVFGLIGLQLEITTLPVDIISSAFICVIIPVLLRFALTLVLLLFKNDLNLKERIFVAMSWMPKATVQAVLAPTVFDLALTHVLQNGINEMWHAEIVFRVSVLSILITAPLGSILIKKLGPKILHKDNQEPIV